MISDSLFLLPGFKSYRARVLDVHDGDTLHLSVALAYMHRAADHDFGFSVYLEAGKLRVHEYFRLLGLNAAELATESGQAARAYFDLLLRAGVAANPWQPLSIETVKQASHDKKEKFGRYLVTVWIAANNRRGRPPWEDSLNAEMIRSQHAVPWDGNGPAPLPPWPIPV